MSAMVDEVEVLEDDEGAGGSRKLIIILAAVVLLLGGGGGVWWFLFSGDAEPAPPEDGAIVTLEALTTTTGEETMRHARVGIAVVLVAGQPPEVLDERIPLLQDALLREIAGMNADQLRSVSGSEELRSRMSAHAREIWSEEVVRRVVLTELLLQ